MRLTPDQRRSLRAAVDKFRSRAEVRERGGEKTPHQLECLENARVLREMLDDDDIRLTRAEDKQEAEEQEARWEAAEAAKTEEDKQLERKLAGTAAGLRILLDAGLRPFDTGLGR